MRISIEIEDNKVCNFTEGALQELNSQSKKVIENLIDEACRVETVRREPDTRQEITQADVIDGARFSQKSHRHKRKLWKIVLRGLCPAVAAVSGFVFEKNDTTSVIWAMVILLIATSITIYLMMEDYYNGQNI